MRRRALSTRTAVGALLAAAVVLVSATAPAHAVPLPRPDTLTVWAGGTYTLAPLANDGTSPLSPGALRLCGLSGVDEQVLSVVQVGDSLLVEAVETFRGTTTFTYDACQRRDRRSTTVTLVVDRLTELRATVRPRGRGQVVVTNANTVPVQVTWGGVRSGRADATLTVPPRASVTVTTRRAAIYWVGHLTDRGVVVTAGDGVLERLQQRPRRS